MRTTETTIVAAVKVAAETVHGTKQEFMSNTTVAHGIIERQARADRRVQHGTTVIATFEEGARFLTPPSLEIDSHALVGKIAAEGTTFEGAKQPFRAT
jgi:hypothetical protein